MMGENEKIEVCKKGGKKKHHTFYLGDNLRFYFT